MTISVYSSSATPLGETIYTFDGVTAPAQYVPTLTVTTERNATGTNTQYRIHIEYPLVTTIDGVTSAPNTLKANFNFTALRNVLNTAEKTRVITELSAFLTAELTNIIEGNAKP